jgi:hypothetical protein
VIVTSLLLATSSVRRQIHIFFFQFALVSLHSNACNLHTMLYFVIRVTTLAQLAGRKGRPGQHRRLAAIERALRVG